MIKFQKLSEIQLKQISNPWLIEYLVPADSCCLIAGKAKSRKSWFVYEILVALATQTKAFGSLAVHSNKPVLLVQGEDSPGIIHDRIDSIALTRGFTANQINNLHVLAGTPFALDDEEQFEWLSQEVRRIQPSIIVLDPIIRFLSKTAESSTSQVSKLLGKLRTLQRETSTSIAIVQHYNKDNEVRGSTDFWAWADAGFFISKPVPHVSQVRLEYKAFSEKPDFFYQLSEAKGGIAPVTLLKAMDDKDE